MKSPVSYVEDELVRIFKDALPELTHIYATAEMKRVPWREEMQKGNLTTPFGILVFGPEIPSTFGGAPYYMYQYQPSYIVVISRDIQTPFSVTTIDQMLGRIHYQFVNTVILTVSGDTTAKNRGLASVMNREFVNNKEPLAAGDVTFKFVAGFSYCEE